MSRQLIAPLVAFDTIFDQCSVAVMDGGGVIYEQTILGKRGQTELILPMFDEALQALGMSVMDVSAWAFNRGPGAFSGIRINTAVVQALSVANGAPCVGVSSLEALAYLAHKTHQFNDGTQVVALIDARQDQLYAGDFVVADGQILAKGEYLLDYHKSVHTDVVVGDGAHLIQTDATTYTVKPTASDIAHLAYPVFLAGGGVSAERALPVYLRDNAWKTLLEQGKKGGG